MLIYKWVPIVEDEHTQPKRSGFARAQTNILAPTGGSIITMSSRNLELRTEVKAPSENATTGEVRRVEQSNESCMYLGNVVLP